MNDLPNVTDMDPAEFCWEYDACKEGTEFASRFKTMKEVMDALLEGEGDQDWVEWIQDRGIVDGIDWEKAVQQNGWALQLVPKELRTEQLCKLAVQQNGWALDYVPKELRTEQLCTLAVQQNGRTLYQVPEELRTEQLCKLAVQQNGLALYHVPWELRTEQICTIAVQQNVRALEFVPEGRIPQVNMNLIVPQDSVTKCEIVKSTPLVPPPSAENSCDACATPSKEPTPKVGTDETEHQRLLQFLQYLKVNDTEFFVEIWNAYCSDVMDFDGILYRNTPNNVRTLLKDFDRGNYPIGEYSCHHAFVFRTPDKVVNSCHDVDEKSTPFVSIEVMATYLCSHPQGSDALELLPDGWGEFTVRVGAVSIPYTPKTLPEDTNGQPCKYYEDTCYIGDITRMEDNTFKVNVSAFPDIVATGLDVQSAWAVCERQFDRIVKQHCKTGETLPKGLKPAETLRMVVRRVEPYTESRCLSLTITPKWSTDNVKTDSI